MEGTALSKKPAGNSAYFRMVYLIALNDFANALVLTNDGLTFNMDVLE